MEAVYPPHLNKKKNIVYWSQRNELEGRIDWERMTATQVFNLVRALRKPYPGAFTFIKQEKVVLHDIEIPKIDVKSSPGKFFFIQGVGPYIMCSDKSILAKNISLPCKIGFFS